MGTDQSPAVRTQKEKLKQALLSEKAAFSPFWPNVSFGLSSSKRDGGTGQINPFTNRMNGTSYSSALDLAYQIDVFGSNRSRLSVAELNVQIAAEELKDTIRRTSKELADHYFQLISLNQQKNLLNNTIALDQKYLSLISTRYKLGTSSAGDLYQVQEQLYSSESSLINLEKRLYQTKERFRALLGFTVKDSDLLIHQKFPVGSKNYPTQISAELFKLRPDIRKQMLAALAADAQVAAALADRFPRFQITAAGNYTSRKNFSDAFRPDNMFWNFVAGLTFPIFDGGALAAAHQARKSQLKEQLIRYRQTLKTAHSDVAEGLYLISRQLELIKLLIKQRDANRRSLNFSSEQFLKGLIGYTVILPILQRSYRIQTSLIEAQLGLLQLRVRIFSSVGGTPEDLKLLKNSTEEHLGDNENESP